MYVCLSVNSRSLSLSTVVWSDHASVSVTEYHLRQLLKPATAVSVGVTVENVMRSSVRDRWIANWINSSRCEMTVADAGRLCS